ncbi:LysR family transcriptional regulator [Streptosporangium sp. NBC_01639]|uniref:LysR family transcriptional regulator n=1 Tax=Streptosporangium sp. NBC_01639 TaxID=2975948 RepID=UPI0038677F4D|nr:LysR family transcriptional regulator [Streptosporangium sp. NBC_01639]
MERHEIEIFLTLAEELHFGRTAERAGVSQSRVSQTLAKLERRIGVKLFERNSRRVALTTIGEQLRAGIEPAHRRIQEEVARATAAGRGITGMLRVGFSGAFTGDLILQVADVFSARHPGTELQIQQVQMSDPYGPLRSGDVDLQVTELPMDEPDLTVGPVLISQPRALLLPSAHSFARHASVSLEDLAEMTLLTVAGSVPAQWREHHFPRQTPTGRPIPQGQAIVHWEDVLSLVLAGKGVCPVAAAGARYYSRPGLAFVPFRDASPIEYALVWPSARETARVRAFAQISREFTESRGGSSAVLDLI